MILLILEARAVLLRFFQKFQMVLTPLVKFFIAFITFHAINGSIGHEPHLMKLPAELVLSFIGTFAPAVILVLLAALVSLAHIYTASPILAILVALLMLILYCFIARFSGKYGYVVLLMPIMFILKLPYVVPLILGLVATPLTIIPMACGVLVYRMFVIIKAAAEMEVSMGINDILEMYIDVIDRFVADKQAIVLIGVFSVIMIVMYLVRKLNIDYVFEISIAAGTIAGILGFLFGDMYLHTQFDITGMVFGMVGAMALALIFQFFRMALEYSAVERVQFEDDDYYYYVKAVPKIKLAVPVRKVKRISDGADPEPENPEDGMVDFSPEPATTSKAERELTEEERYALGEELPDESLLEEFSSEQDENG